MFLQVITSGWHGKGHLLKIPCEKRQLKSPDTPVDSTISNPTFDDSMGDLQDPKMEVR
jgi:hypothetical protein